MHLTATSEPTATTPRLAQRRQFIVITAVAVAVYVTMRLLPTGTNLNHTDFSVAGGNSIQFCDATNPQFIPVVAVRSPVTTTLTTDAPAAAGREVRGVLSLHTFTGKPIAPQDLLEVHEHLLHLMIVDPSLADYQHVHPQPGKVPGEWSFRFTPRFGGTYRLFADFTPAATARGLYATVDLAVSGAAAPPNPLAISADKRPPGPLERDGYRYELTTTNGPIRVSRQADLEFRIVAVNGGRVPLGPIMGAYAHVVAFDSARSGFAHLHPSQADPLAAPDAVHPVLQFKVTIPTAGRYVIWTQVNLGGHEAFAPFWFTVE